MVGRVTHYDYIHGVLSSRGLVTIEPMYAKVLVGEDDELLACRVIEDCGGVVTNVNPHESGVTITFEAQNESNVKEHE